MATDLAPKTPYTSGVWQVKPGRADEFVEAWTEFARWTSERVPGSRRAVLVRDTADLHRFMSFGPWESEAAIAAWRDLDGFKQRVGRIRDLLERFEARTLELVATSD
ncbi:MAG TPA: antibiotic biosynthesis monooxygenase family protein [Candidatus Limnocylindria bacterium]